jgi:acyl-CoA synthetase (AMP-forming)/AMP-acid ligase II
MPVEPPPQHNLAAVYDAVAARVPDRTAVVCRDRRLTYREMTRRTRQLAHVFRDHGLGSSAPGRTELAPHESQQDHVAIYAHNGNEYLEAMIGAFQARIVPLNVNYRYVADELRYVLNDSGAKSIVFHSAFASTLATVLPDLPALELLLQIDDGSPTALLAGATWYEEALAAAAAERPDWADTWSPDDRYLLYTGGTTGMPKGVLWRQADIFRSAMGGRNLQTRELFATLDQIGEVAARNPAPHVTLPAAPFMHGAAHWVALTALNQGATVVIQDDVTRLDATDICTVIDRESVTYLQIVGDSFGRPIVDEMERGSYDLSSLRILLSGGAALSASVKERFLERIPDLTLIEGLGSSEGGSQGVQTTVRSGTNSSPVAGVTFAPSEGSVVVSEDLERVLKPGDDEVGWLAKSGHDLPMGYLGDPEKTARTFPTIDGSRMSVPGDRARWLVDGTIELLGRDSLTINSGGEKIFTEEVESAILFHADVEDVVVASRHSAQWGSEVVAIVRLRDGATASSDDLAAEAARHIARYKLPKMWVFVDAIRRSAAGKADYRWAAEVATNGG